MDYNETMPDDLAKAVISNFRKEVNYPEIPTDGAKKAAPAFLY